MTKISGYSFSEARALLAWYDDSRRDLPWRVDNDPYRVWISEIMLQQTQVKTVIPYYRAFLERFPDVEALAAAALDDVLASWSGLGYYRRARQLHRAAREIVEGGHFPSCARELEELPGIGPYTAAAVASIVFGEVVPVVDGNVERLLSRILALDGDPKRRDPRREILARATDLLVPERPGDSNQALMELGATVCLPRRPRCGSCPLAASCWGRREGDPERYPPPRQRRRTEKIAWSVALVEDAGRMLFFRRPETSEILPGMWELPNVPHDEDAAGMEQALHETYGGIWRLGTPAFRVRHAVTYRSLTLHVHRAELAGGALGEGRESAWIAPRERPEFGVSSMFEKVLSRLDCRGPATTSVSPTAPQG